MPFKSKAQQRWMFAEHPQMAQRWARVTPDIKDLPEHVGKGEDMARVELAPWMGKGDTKKTGTYKGKSNKLGGGGRAQQLKDQGVPGGVIGAIARKKKAAPGQANFHKGVGSGGDTKKDCANCGMPVGAGHDCVGSGQDAGKCPDCGATMKNGKCPSCGYKAKVGKGHAGTPAMKGKHRQSGGND